jgi:hypothetical protein
VSVTDVDGVGDVLVDRLSSPTAATAASASRYAAVVASSDQDVDRGLERLPRRVVLQRLGRSMLLGDPVAHEEVEVGTSVFEVGGW